MKEFHQLENLDLTNTLVTDAGLTQLVGLSQLKHLQLAGTNVTEVGINALQKALPNCEIMHR